MNKIKWLITTGILLLLLTSFLTGSVFGARVETTALAKLDVYDADIRTVFRGLGELGNISVLMDPEVKGNVTVSFKEGVSVSEAIEFLSETYGYSYHWMPNNRLIIIGSPKTFENFQSFETRVYHFSYAKADQVVDAIKNIVPPDKLGVDMRTNQITITASVLQHQNIEEVLKYLDREMPQIVIEIRVEELSKEAKDYLGVPWAKDDVVLNFTGPSISTPSSKSLEFLEQKSMARLLTNPKVATTDGQEGSIFIGEKQPYETTSTQNGVTTYTVNWIDVGTTLQVTPRINQDDVVTVNVHAIVSNITDKVKIGGNDIPVTRNREISSVIRLRDGETFTLSGLSEVQRGESETGLKGVSKIPLIGWLFKSKTIDPNSSKEVCIFITPRIVKISPVDTSKNKGVTIDKKSSADENSVSDQNVNNTAVTEPKNTETTATTTQTPDQKDSLDKPKTETTVPVPTTETDKTSSITANTDETIKTNDDTSEEATTDSETNVTEEKTPVEESNSSITDEDTTETADVESPENQKNAINSVSEPEVEKVVYHVASGDSIASIAKVYGLKADDIITVNNLTSKVKLQSGRSLIIPVPKSHMYKVKPKETLWRISKRYGTSIGVLLKINGIKDMTKVNAGQIIVLPVAVDEIANNNY